MTIAFYAAALFVPLIFLRRTSGKEIIGAAILITIFIAVNSGFILGDVSPGWDTLAYSLGLHYLKGVLQAGGLPGWNPYFNAGEPLYLYHFSYDSVQWFFYAALDHVFPVKPAALFKLYFASLFVFYNVGCYLFFRKLFDDRRVVLFCFAVSLFSAAFVVSLNEYSSISPYFPFLAYFFLEFVEKRRPAALLLVLGLIGVAANVYLPHFILLAFVVFAACWFVFARDARFKLPEIKGSAVWLVAGAVLAFVAMLPVFYVYFKMPDFVTPMRFRFRGDIRIFDPSVSGQHQTFEALYTFITIPKSANAHAPLFVGILPLALAVVGFLRSDNRFRKALAVAAAAIFVISLGRNTLFFEAVRSLPLFKYVRQYVLFEVFVQFFVIGLAGMGLEWLFKLNGKDRKAALYLTAKVFAAVLIIFAAITFSELDKAERPLITSAMYLVFFTLAAAAAYAALTRKTRAAYYLPIAVVVLSGGFLQWYLENVRMGDIRRGLMKGEVSAADERERLDALLDAKNGGNVWRPRRTEANKQRLIVDDYNTFESALARHEQAFFEPVERNLLLSKRLYSMREMRESHKEYFGIGHPKMFMTTSYRALPDNETIGAMKAGLADFKSKGTVFISDEFDGRFKPVSAEIEKAANPAKNVKIDDGVSVIVYNPDRVVVEVNSPSAALLVYLQSFDKDWRVYVNEAEATLLRVNLNFQAVGVPKGVSKVEFVYRTPYKGLFLAHLMAAALVFGIMFFYFLRKPQPACEG